MSKHYLVLTSDEAVGLVRVVVAVLQVVVVWVAVRVVAVVVVYVRVQVLRLLVRWCTQSQTGSRMMKVYSIHGGLTGVNPRVVPLGSLIGVNC